MTSENVSQQLFVAHSTPRRSTYEVLAPPPSSRRSTYSLRNQTITNIIDVEREKLKFEAIASPGLLNESLENAALRLVKEESFLSPGPLRYNSGRNRESKTSVKRISEELDAFNFSSIATANSDLSDHSGNLSPKVCLLDIKSISDPLNLDLTKTLNLNQLVSCTQVSSQHSQNVTNDSEELSSHKSAKTSCGGPQHKMLEQFPDSKASTEFKVESFSERISPVPLDLDKFDLSTVITSSKNSSEVAGSLDHQFSEFSPWNRHSIDLKQQNLNDTFTKSAESYDSNNKVFEVGVSCLTFNDYDIETKAKVEPPSESSSQSDIFPDSLEREISETFVIKQEPQDVSQVSASETKIPMDGSISNLLEAPSDHMTLTEQEPQIWDVPPPKREQEKAVKKNLDHDPQIYNVLSTKNTPGSSLCHMITNNMSPAKVRMGVREVDSHSLERNFSETFLLKCDPQNIVNQESPTEIVSSCSLCDSSSKDIIQTDQKPVIWDISPPKKKQENAVDQHLDYCPKIKKALPKRSISGTKSSIYQMTPKNILPTKTKVGVREIQHTNDDSDNVFLVPTKNVKRHLPALQKTFNTSPPKIRKISQDFKVKRLATPIHKKTTLTSLTGKFLKLFETNTEV